MAKRDVEPIESGAGIFADFVAKLMAEIRKRGGTGGELQQTIKAGGEETLGKMADLLVGIKQVVGNIFTVTVNYSRSLAKMISAGQYDGYVNPDITDKHFSLPKLFARLPIKLQLQLELVHFNRYISSNDVIAELKQRGMRPATLPELLAFSEKYPEEQRKYSIVALGSFWQDWYDWRVPCLWSDVGGRFLGLALSRVVWGEYYRFLAVRESC